MRELLEIAAVVIRAGEKVKSERVGKEKAFSCQLSFMSCHENDYMEEAVGLR